MNRFLQRLREPSTYAALGALGGIFGIDELAKLGVPEVATSLAVTVSLLAGIFMSEKGSQS